MDAHREAVSRSVLELPARYGSSSDHLHRALHTRDASSRHRHVPVAGLLGYSPEPLHCAAVLLDQLRAARGQSDLRTAARIALRQGLDSTLLPDCTMRSLPRSSVRDLSFFEVTPIGRLTNRFGKDANTVDDSLPFIANILLAQFFLLLGSTCVMAYNDPPILLLLVVVAVIYYRLQLFYRCSSRELRRLDSAYKSPVYTIFSECLESAVVLRSLGSTCLLHFDRRLRQSLDTAVRVGLSVELASQWLGVRLQLLGALITTVLAASILINALLGIVPVSAGLAGLALLYSFTIINNLSGFLNALSETEQELVSVERMLEYRDLPNEFASDESLVSLDAASGGSAGSGGGCGGGGATAGDFGCTALDEVNPALALYHTAHESSCFPSRCLSCCCCCCCCCCWCCSAFPVNRGYAKLGSVEANIPVTPLREQEGGGSIDANKRGGDEEDGVDVVRSAVGDEEAPSELVEPLLSQQPQQSQLLSEARANPLVGAQQQPQPPQVVFRLMSPQSPGPAFASPEQQCLELRSLHMRYPSQTADTLRGLTVRIESGSRVAVVGRTGSGKSSLLRVLLRLNDYHAGQVLLGGCSLRSVPRLQLRRRLCVVPQRPLLFSGTVRFNLDQFGLYSDVELMAALRLCRFIESTTAAITVATAAEEALITSGGDGGHIPSTQTVIAAATSSSNSGALDPSEATLRQALALELSSGGSNLSLGQQQLLCLARGLLRRADLVLVDEATAAVDGATEQLLYAALADYARETGATVIMVCHKLQGVDQVCNKVRCDGAELPWRLCLCYGTKNLPFFPPIMNVVLCCAVLCCAVLCCVFLCFASS